MLLVSVILSLTTLLDTLPALNRIKIYNQVGNIQIVKSDTNYLKITVQKGLSKKNPFNMKKKIKKGFLSLQITPILSCTGCKTDVKIGLNCAKTLELEITSGNINIDAPVKSIKASLVSGDFTASGSYEKLDIENLSGTITIDNISVDSLNLILSSGNAFVGIHNLVVNGNISILSGKLVLKVPKEQSIYALVPYKKDTFKKDGKGYLFINILSGKLKIEE